MILAILVAALAIYIVGQVVIPELATTAMGLGRNIERGIENLTVWINENFKQDSVNCRMGRIAGNPAAENIRCCDRSSSERSEQYSHFYCVCYDGDC